MNYKCKSKSLPKLIESMIDNLLSTLWKELKMPALLSRAGIDQALWTLRDHDGYLHMLWRWTNSPGTRMFCHQSLQHMLKMHHGTVHDLLNNPKMNWRGWQWALAKTGLVQHDQGIRALVVDDSIKERRSKKMDVVAFHDDHARGYTVKVHQVVALGLSTEHGHYPLDQEMSISCKGQQSKGGGALNRSAELNQ